MKFPPFEHHLIQNRLYIWTSSDVLIKDIKVIFQHHQAILARKEIHLLFWDSGLKKVQPVIKAMTGYDNRRQLFLWGLSCPRDFGAPLYFHVVIYLYFFKNGRLSLRNKLLTSFLYSIIFICRKYVNNKGGQCYLCGFNCQRYFVLHYIYMSLIYLYIFQKRTPVSTNMLPARFFARL